MTVPSESYGGGPYEGDGANESFAWTGLFNAVTEFDVVHTDSTGNMTTLTYDDHYTVSALGGTSGTVTYPKAGSGYDTLPEDEYISIVPALPYTQETDLTVHGIYKPSLIETAFDKVTRLIQQLKSTTADATYGTSTELNAETAQTAALEATNTLLRYTFDDSTSMADPGAGDIRLNNASFASVTAIAIDDTSANTDNPDISAYINTWADSTSTNKGTLFIQKISAPESLALFTITGLTDNSGWTELAVTHVASNGSFSDTDVLAIKFFSNGDEGEVSFDYVDQTTTITPSSDADVTITAGEAGHGRLKLVDGSWTSAHNIIVPTSERRFWIDNSAGTYDATVKTSGGTGITVKAGTSRPVICDGTNVVDPLTEFAGLNSQNVFVATQKWSKGADIASASALTLGTDGNYFDVTGTTTITSIATVGIGTQIKLHFDGALTLTHHATDLILPGGANITTAAGDEAEFVEYASGDWRCTNYTKADGKPITTQTEDYILIRDIKTSGTNGGTPSGTGAWYTRDLTEETEDTGNNVTLASNQITFTNGGTYRYRVVSVFYLTNESQIRLYNVTDTAVVDDSEGLVVRSSASYVTTVVSESVGRVEVSDNDVIRVEYRVTTASTNGLGIAAGWGEEIYAQVEFWKEA